MPSFADTLGALALLLPLGSVGGETSALDAPVTAPQHAPAISEPAKAGDTPKLPEALAYPVSGRPAPLDALKVTVRQSQSRGSVRIERRVFVRIAPRGVSARRNMLAQLPVRSQPQRYKESKAQKCVRVEQIAGVETGSGNRLLLFLRDAEIMSVNLEKACRARDFYSGFYVERNKDGKLCVERDTLQSRNGARCDIARMMHLKAIED